MNMKVRIHIDGRFEAMQCSQQTDPRLQTRMALLHHAWPEPCPADADLAIFSLACTHLMRSCQPLLDEFGFIMLHPTRVSLVRMYHTNILRPDVPHMGCRRRRIPLTCSQDGTWLACQLMEHLAT